MLIVASCQWKKIQKEHLSTISLSERNVLAATCLQQSEEGSQQERDSMPDGRCQNVSSPQLLRKPASVTQNKVQTQLLEYRGVHDFTVHLPINKGESKLNINENHRDKC